MAPAFQFSPDASVWIPSTSHVWEEARVVRQLGDQLEVSVGLDNTKAIVKSDTCHPKEEQFRTVDDMTRLSFLHEPGVLHTLYQRYQINQIYTYTGQILIAVNPYAPLPKLYDRAMREQYLGAPLGAQAPHVFAVADASYRAMMEGARGQSIIISGESGAGKTETTKLVMEYLATVCSVGEDGFRGIERMVLESNPLLEAFGNAKTQRNNNSSRFGKFIKVKFDSKGRVCGAEIVSYLLEKSRVVYINQGERNYHCFYQLCYGASAEEAKKYGLANYRAEDFHYLNQSSCFELDKLGGNSVDFGILKRAMEILQFSAEEQDSIFRVLAAILHLGNVQFETGEKDVIQIMAGKAEEHLHHSAHLLQVDANALRRSLLNSVMNVAGDTITLPVRDIKAGKVKRNSLAKNLYSFLFDWIVAKVNVAIGQIEKVSLSENSFIGILDIYGFEQFQHNSFEQLCINLANEKLQNHFNFNVLKSEQEEYEREKINWSRIDFTDNQDCLDLIEANNGILAQLDNACLMDSTTADVFTRKLANYWSKHERFSKPKTSKTDFILHHYAGKVLYNTEEFIPKNKDAVIPEHFQLLSNSKDPFIANVCPKQSLPQASKSKFLSLGSSFKAQLARLMQDIGHTQPHYIRCIKPNLEKAPHVFENRVVVMQLQSGGVLEAVRMCSAGYPSRKDFGEFLTRFRILAPLLFNNRDSQQEQCKKVLGHVSLEGCEIGISKVFLRSGQMAVLENLRLERMNAARTIFFSVRSIIERKSAALVLQTLWRGFREVKLFRLGLEIKAAIFIQSFVRMWQQKNRYLSIKKSVIIFQTIFRARLAKQKVSEMRKDKAAVKIQNEWRKYVRLRPWTRLFRALEAQKELQILQQEIRITANPMPPPSIEKPRELQSFMIVRRMREKAERAKREKEDLLETVQLENKGLKEVIASKAEEVDRLEDEVRYMQQLALTAAISLENLVEKVTESDSRGHLGSSSLDSPSNKASRSNSIHFRPLNKQGGGADRLIVAVEQTKQMVSEMVEESVSLREAKTQAEDKISIIAKERATTRWRETDAKHQREVDELKARLRQMEAKLARKDHEMEVLGNHVLSRTMLEKPNPLKQQEMFFSAVGGDNNLGFSRQGQPIAAILVFQALQYWRAFELQDNTIFGLVIETFQQADRNGNSAQISYWLQNTITLYALVQNHESEKKSVFHSEDFQARTGNLDTELFKMKLGFSIVRLYVTLRDNVRRELLMLLSGNTEAWRRAVNDSSVASRSGSGAYWVGITVVLEQLLDTLQSNLVSPALVKALVRQLLHFVNLKIFNSLLVRSRWCPCTFSNGNVLEAALKNFKSWLRELDGWLETGDEPFEDELVHLEEAVSLLLYEDKQSLTLESLLSFCGRLSPNQLWHICSYFEDDVYNTPGVHPRVLSRLWKLLGDPAPELLADERSIPFAIEEVISTERKFDPEEIEIPARLLNDEKFSFLSSWSASSQPLVPTPPRNAPRLGPSLTRSKASRRQGSAEGGHAANALTALSLTSSLSPSSSPSPSSLGRRGSANLFDWL